MHLAAVCVDASHHQVCPYTSAMDHGVVTTLVKTTGAFVASQMMDPGICSASAMNSIMVVCMMIRNLVCLLHHSTNNHL